MQTIHRILLAASLAFTFFLASPALGQDDAAGLAEPAELAELAALFARLEQRMDREIQPELPELVGQRTTEMLEAAAARSRERNAIVAHARPPLHRPAGRSQSSR